MLAKYALVVAIAALAGCSASTHDLAAKPEPEALQAWLEADPEAVHDLNDMKKTPLHYAVTYGRKDSVAILLAHNAEVNAKDVTGMTPLHCAATLSRIDQAQLLIDAGAAIEAQDNFGDTPLHSAALHGQVKMIDWLIARGANVSAANAAGKTPADLARRERKTEAEAKLLAATEP